ncbi:MULTISPECIES: hypothetical protein [unclassified Caballeronia]|uniref:hypothetical protein n=1 Tax=unclassified Caballeronia TaxID=2646786 RepID=UPI002858D951|nr:MULTISPECIES: hypothetical protein [unclassified Caballeronia]MDR5776250.1 hypothetical protein [Caballeronia sp. LZ002]MDR5801169.1 hypothetical protein [Caballeronia sp. LZ001]MDR5851690.1 hypothetical protein [Caballeronia sp. LZ003]
MERAINDNALLDIARLSRVDQIYKTIGMGSAVAISIGMVWFLCVAVPAGALWK